jgi:hypothetical protein
MQNEQHRKSSDFRTMTRITGIALTLIFLASAVSMQSQVPVQTIRGTVTDKISQAAIPGAIVRLQSSTLAVVSDAEGRFALPGVPVGKQTLRIGCMGYKAGTLENLSVNSGKELVLNIAMEEDVTAMETVEVVANIDKSKPLNDMSGVSTRAFSVEETQRFAAAVNDPARMALSFAGVVAAGDGNNLISIRGNSPNGLLWRMEGVDIPNPNHFSNVGTSGGGISILSAQLLNNSDFSTGAFAAEYGNALSGVFDLKLRKGNNQRREYTLQVGLLGVDVAAEGPFRQGYDGSFLVNYRYSTLSVIGKLGVPLGDALTNFQDLSFNVSLPTKKMGTFGLFGFGGLSEQFSFARRDSLKWKEDEFYRNDERFFANTGAVGITNTALLPDQSYIRSALVFSGTGNGYTVKRLQPDYESFTREYEQSFTQSRVTLSSVYTRKLNAKNSIRGGVIASQPGYRLLMSTRENGGEMQEKINSEGYTGTAQGFFHWNTRLLKRLSAHAGLHYLQLFFNNTNSVEPRGGLRYELTNRGSLNLGYGLHSQLQPIGIYFATYEKNGVVKTNRDLGLSKAHHLVLGYSHLLTEHLHLKIEGYYQHLFNIPVSTDTQSTFSMLNVLDGYYAGGLQNTGLGKNQGLELTFERFLHRNWYYLLSASLYDSKYRTNNHTWFNTRFNTNRAVSLTMGKEWIMPRKNRIFGFNIKSMYVGGFRYTPIDLESSRAAGEGRLITSRTFAAQNPDYYRLDVRVSLKRNYRRMTGTLSLDLQNATNHRNVGGQYFDEKTGEIRYWYQTPLIPVLSYRLEL